MENILANVPWAGLIAIYKEAERHVTYVRIYKENIDKFKEKDQTLRAKRASVQEDVDAANRKKEKIRLEVDDWCKRVDKKIEEEEKKVKELEDEAEKNCFMGLCPNMMSRYQISKKAEEGANAFNELLQEGDFVRVSHGYVVEDAADGPPKDFVAFESREKVFKEIMEALKDGTISMVGVYGMAGVGKSTLVNEVVRQVKKGNFFDAVVTGVVNQTPDIQRIQDEIADSLGLKFEEVSVMGRARSLCRRLKKEKKILVVLDDLWARLDLEKVGVPVGNEHEGSCTVLLTSRILDVLSNMMGAQKSFEIGGLEVKESWELLKKMAGDTVESPELRSTAVEVAKKCSGLPLAIATVGRALRNKHVHVWNDALRKLERPSPANFTGLPEPIYSAIEFSYNHLGSQELRQTFLLCSLLGPHAYNGDLLKYTMGLGIFHGVNTVEETRDRLLTVLGDLKASCLLQDCYYCKEHINMHGLICDVAFVIASKDNVFALKPNAVLQNLPDGDRMKMLNMINLNRASITFSELPEGLDCPQLTFFHMHSKDRKEEIPSNFFMKMKSLRVLDLTKLQFSSLPSSITYLINLRTLCLDQCVLGDIALIGDLKNLESLSLLKSDIEMLPEEIGRLIKLRLFDLSGCTKLKRIPPRVLSSLTKLEELYMGDSFVEWEEERDAYQQTNATLAELKFLPCLTTLEIQIPNAQTMPAGVLFFEKLERYKIFIGKAWLWTGEHEYSRTLKLELDRSIHHLDHGIKMLLNKTEELHLDDIKGSGFALPGSSTSSRSQAQHELALFGEKFQSITFRCLKKLCLNSINVETIRWHHFSHNSFRTLTSLIIQGCGNLKYLLSSSMARTLVNLECLNIVECKWLREIIFSEENDIEEEVVLFPQLNSLKIKSLQHLVGFCSKDYKIEFPSLKLLDIEHCPTLKGFIHNYMVENQHFSSQALFDEKVAIPSLEKLRIVHLRNLKMIWHNQLSVNSFRKLMEMKVQHCNELVSIFPCDMWSTFQRLETLTVCSCAKLEEIFELQSLDMEETHVMATQFRELHFHDLPKLKHIWSKDPRGILTFQNLSVIQVYDCWSLNNVFPASIARVLPQLKDLDIKCCGVEKVVAMEEGSDTCISFEFNKLSSLALWDLPKLKCFYPGIHTTKWPMLKKLRAWHCKKMKIFDTDINHNAEDQGQKNPPIQQHQPLFSVEKIITKLEEVSLNSDDIAIIFDNDNLSCRHFIEIKVLTVLCYHDISSIFPISFLERFSNLEKLEIGCCEFEELFSYEGAGTFLPLIKSLKLNGLHKVRYIWKEELGLDHFIPNLESLEVIVCHNLLSLGSSPAPFQNLRTLEVESCKAMINLVTSSSAVLSLVQLKILKIRDCVSMKEVVGNEGGEATDDIIFNRLKCLELRNLRSLRSFCSSNHKFIFPALEQVIVIKCPELEIFCNGDLSAPMLKGVQATREYKRGEWAGNLNSTVKHLYTQKVGYQEVENLLLSDSSRSIDIWKENLIRKDLDFTNLKVLEVKDCSSLTYIFTTSMALSLVQLSEIDVKNCPMMEQIIRKEGAEEATKSQIMLYRLRTVTLESCSSLTSFFLGSTTLECPSLQVMKIVDCPKMFEFTSAFPRNQDMERIGGVNVSFFNDKVFCPKLWHLELCSLNIQKVWPEQRQVTPDNVQNLRILLVKDCHSLKYILPSSLCEKFSQLNQLGIFDCTNVEEVICTERLTIETQIELIEAESTTKFVFPKMWLLELNKLPKLKCFYSKIHTTKWPLLQSLWVIGCDKVEKLFATDFVERQGESQLEIFQQPLFWVNEDTFPSLECLLLEANGSMEEIWHRQLPTKYFPKLNWLKISRFPKNAVALSNCYILSLPNLESLEVSESFFNELFHCEGHGVGAEEEHIGALARLKELRLSQLPELRHLKKDESPVGETFSNLKILIVLGCDKLENVLVPSSVSFRNLTTLKVSKCHGLTNLLTLPTARSMMLLERMSVIDCQMMIEIIASTSDEVIDGIVFSKLKSLKLGSLSTLSRFCSGNYTLGFPSLQKLIMGQCPKMESFSEGEVSTPMLQGVQSTEGKYIGRWEGNLNAFVRHLFEEKAFPCM